MAGTTVAVREYAIDTSRTLGAGFRCQVYAARNTKTGAKLAARVCPVPRASECDPLYTRLACLHEIDIMKRLAGHPNIAHLVDYVIEDTRIITFMEAAHTDLLEWLILASLSRKNRLSEPQCRRIFRQLLSALVFTHSLNIAHRDVKLENVLLYTDESAQPEAFSGFSLPPLRAALTDWNLSTRYPNFLTKPAGSPMYAAPELVDGREFHSGRPCDVWSLGVLTYAMLVGKQPFNEQESTRDEIFHNICHAAPVMPSHLSPSAQKLLADMLCKQPLMRPTAAMLQQRYEWVQASEVEPIYAHAKSN